MLTQSIFGRLRGALGWLLIAPFLLGPTCGSDLGEKILGEPCTRDRECQDGLMCRGGTCQEAPADAAGADAAPGGDAAPMDGAASD